MLPHSLTLLLEGEGYILADVLRLDHPDRRPPAQLRRQSVHAISGLALLLNLKAQFWIALVLAVAAIYEATEVILMNR